MRNRFTCFSALLLIAVAGCSVPPRTESSDTALEVEATQAVISWLTTQKPMAGFRGCAGHELGIGAGRAATGGV